MHRFGKLPICLRPISHVFLNQFLNACFFEDAVCEECASLANQGRQSLEEPRKNLRLPVHKRVYEDESSKRSPTHRDMMCA
jgi:hypothetical protein